MGMPARIGLPSVYCAIADRKVTGSVWERGCHWVNCAPCRQIVAVARSFSICAKSRPPGPLRNVGSAVSMAAPSRFLDEPALSPNPMQMPMRVMDLIPASFDLQSARSENRGKDRNRTTGIVLK